MSTGKQVVVHICCMCTIFRHYTLFP